MTEDRWAKHYEWELERRKREEERHQRAFERDQRIYIRQGGMKIVYFSGNPTKKSDYKFDLKALNKHLLNK